MFSMTKTRGFTLIELMIVVAILSILAGVALPVYQDYVRKVRRSDAAVLLTEAAQFMERFNTANRRYDEDTAGAGVAIPADLAQSPKTGADAYYNITIQAVDQTGFTLVATPVGGQVGDGIITITNTGARGWDKNNNGAIEADENCWVKKCT